MTQELVSSTDRTPERPRSEADTLVLSVHGPRGVLDLVVPAGATGADVSREYARQAGTEVVPHLSTAVGAALPADRPLAAAGVEPGDLVVATVVATVGGDHLRRTRTPSVGRRTDRARPGPLSALWFGLAAALALLGGWWAGQAGSGALSTAAALVLLATALLACAPGAQLSDQRAVAAPAFGAAAALAVAWQPGVERLPMVLGVAALGGAVTAAVARAWSEEQDEALSVWMVAGAATFALTGLAAVAGLSSAVVWSVALVLAVLSARFVPSLAVDVGDQALLDLERLAVTAWSARDTGGGRRARAIVSADDLAGVVARGSRLVTASSAVVALTAVVAAPMLLVSATGDLDRIGARAEVLLAGAALLLSASSFRHRAARALLRTAGLACWAAGAVVVLGLLGRRELLLVGVAAVLLGGLSLVVAVAAGRGWRSVWWARRAEQAEGVAGAAAVAAALVASGLFRYLWELTSEV